MRISANDSINMDEVVNELLTEMSFEQIMHLKHLKQSDLINEHFGFSIWVRSQLNNIPVQPGEAEVYQSTHIDEISSKLTEMLWKKIQVEH
jgi:hypothetical protein